MNLSITMFQQKYIEGLCSGIRVLHLLVFNLFEQLPERVLCVITVITGVLKNPILSALTSLFLPFALGKLH